MSKSKMPKSLSSRILSNTAFVFTVSSIFFLLCPLLIMGSYSMQDSSAISNYPPTLIGGLNKSVEIILDYTDFQEWSDDELRAVMQEDGVYAMYAAISKFTKHSIGEIRVYGTINGETVFYQRQHNMALRVQLDYGAYRSLTAYNRQTLIYRSKGEPYKSILDITPYEFNRGGLSEKANLSALDNDRFCGEMKSWISSDAENMYTVGKLLGCSLSKNPLLAFESLIYFIQIPQYMYANEPRIAQYGLLAFIFNTMLVMGWAVITQVGLCSLTAFSLSRLFSRRMSKILMMFFLASMMIPFMCIMLPQMILMKNLNALNNYGAMTLPYLYPFAFYIFLFKGFFDRLPQDLMDAARMDGASHLYTFTRICMPLSKPIISVLTLNVIVSAWNDFFWYLNAANRTHLWTINLALYSISVNPMTKNNVAMGVSFITVLPVILLAFIFQKQIKESVVSAGIKG